jgi:hypothetical protein
MRLETVREGINLSRWDLFVKSGVHTSKIGLIEDGYSVATEKDKSALSKALGVKVDAVEWPTGANHGKWRWRK